MLRITADVNGYVIGRLFIHNKNKPQGNDVWLYDAAVLSETDDRDTIIGIEDVPHARSRPWHELVENVSRRLND